MRFRKQRGHALICGMTLSGKTVLARRIAAEYHARGTPIIVHDRFWSDWGQKSDPARIFVTNRDKEFLDWCAMARRCAIFIDEAPELCSNDKRGGAFHWLATQGRHWGHRVHFISQSPMGVSHQIRANCTELFSFRLKRSEATKLYRDTGEQWALETADLPAGQFFHSAPFEKTIRRRVF